MFKPSQKNYHIFEKLKSTDFSQCTHLAIGAHPDDIEIMAGHGIEQCLGDESKSFAGITVTTGSGSLATSVENTKLSEVRKNEQDEAARKGDYLVCAQLGFESSDIKGAINQSLVDDLASLIKEFSPQVIYTHNPFDKHSTHVSVLSHTLLALKKISFKPDHFYGCEVWRGLDWVGDERKVCLDIENPEFIADLVRLHKSQCHENKDFAQAMLGRMRSNATFFDAYSNDDVSHVVLALDLLSLLESGSNLDQFVQSHLGEFILSVESGLETYGGDL